MPVSSDPIVMGLIALVMWGFWAACVYHDHKTGRLAGRAAPDTSTPPPRGDRARKGRTSEGGDR